MKDRHLGCGGEQSLDEPTGAHGSGSGKEDSVVGRGPSPDMCEEETEIGYVGESCRRCGGDGALREGVPDAERKRKRR